MGVREYVGGSLSRLLVPLSVTLSLSRLFLSLSSVGASLVAVTAGLWLAVSLTLLILLPPLLPL